MRGVVTAVGQGGLFVQDRFAGVWIFAAQPADFHPGDEVVVEGVTGAGTYSPVIVAKGLRKVGRAPMPRARQAGFAQMSSGNLDSQFIAVSGLVRAAGLRSFEPDRSWLKLGLSDGVIFVSLPLGELARANALIGSRIRLTAVVSCTKNGGRQITAPTLVTSSLDSATVLKPHPSDLFSGPVMPISNLMQYRSGASVERRVKVQGTVTYDKPGQLLVIEDQGKALSVNSMQAGTLHLGERIEAIGFPALTSTGPVLQDSLFRLLGRRAPVQPSPVRSDELLTGEYNNTLVSLEGRLVRRVLEPSQEVLLVQNGPAVVLAELARGMGSGQLSKLREGMRVRLTGICVLDVQGTWNLGPVSSYTISYKVLMREPGDVQVLEPPSWWTARHLVFVSAGLCLVLLALSAFGIQARVKHWRLKMVLAERERFSHELHDTLAQGFAGLGFQLQAIRRAIPTHMPELHAQVDLATKLARHSHKEARVSFDQNLPEVERGGEVLASLEATARLLTEGGGVQVEAERVGNPVRLPAKLQEALRRIGQEAIANAVRHAAPTRIRLELAYSKEAVQLTVRDDGCGFQKSGSLLGFGLNGMRRRAAAVQGAIEITTGLSAGTVVAVTMPLPRFAAMARAWFTLLTGSSRSSHATSR